jgi:hypothetical protein
MCLCKLCKTSSSLSCTQQGCVGRCRERFGMLGVMEALFIMQIPSKTRPGYQHPSCPLHQTYWQHDPALISQPGTQQPINRADAILTQVTRASYSADVPATVAHQVLYRDEARSLPYYKVTCLSHALSHAPGYVYMLCCTGLGTQHAQLCTCDECIHHQRMGLR